MTSAPAKKAAPKKPAAKPAAKSTPKASTAKASPEKATVAKEPKAEKPPASTPTAGTTLRARDLIARVAEATGAKVKDIKLTVEATLSELGRALDAGEALNLPPLGRVKITPAKAEGGSQPMKLKLRRGAGNAGGAAKKNAEKEALAEGGEDS